jgi:hypothetical protein
MQESGLARDRDDEDGRFAFGLTALEVERLRGILSRESATEVSMAEAWGRAIELLALFRMLLGPLPEDPDAARFEHRRT